MNLTTLQFRIKDETSGKHLKKMGWAVNFVWNYCNEANQDRWKKFLKTYSAFDLSNKTSGCSKELSLHSQTVQAVCEQFAKSSKQEKKVRLGWRSRKRSLGWIPFKASGVKVSRDIITYQGRAFRFWQSRPIEGGTPPGTVRFGSFTQNSEGHWFVNLVVEDKAIERVKTGKEVGIDLGLKTLATLSDGVELSRENLTRKYEDRLAIAQRARKKKQVTAIHLKIKNKRKDWNQKTTTRLVRTYDRIAVGNVSSSILKKTRMAKSVSDAGWSSFKTMLAYKAIALGIEVKEVNERFSTVTCSVCKERTGPKGQANLGVRSWECTGCGASHQRDVNAAKNILNSFHLGHQMLSKESPAL